MDWGFMGFALASTLSLAGGGLLLLIGAPGAGKTALLREACGP